jgi:DNA-binding transcriptional ArsR family regulator
MSSPRLRSRVQHLKRRAAAFAALGDATRLGLVTALAHGPPQSISQLASHSRLTRQGLTRHLRTLEHAGLLQSRRIGRESMFEFRPEPLQELSDYLKEVSKDWDDALGRLKSFVER